MRSSHVIAKCHQTINKIMQIRNIHYLLKSKLKHKNCILPNLFKFIDWIFMLLDYLKPWRDIAKIISITVPIEPMSQWANLTHLPKFWPQCQLPIETYLQFDPKGITT